MQKLGLSLLAMEQERVVLADVIKERPTPASQTSLAKGCEILEVNGQAVSGWPDLVEKLLKFTSRLEVMDVSKDIKNDWVKDYGEVVIFRKVWQDLELDRYSQIP